MGSSTSNLSDITDRRWHECALASIAKNKAPGDSQAIVSCDQDPDVLDTWFSSGLWPMSTLSWPDESAIQNPKSALNLWNPTSLLTTARIITLWVSRMVMFNLYFLDRLPFSDVFIHAMIQDGEGRKMSKSLGNGVDRWTSSNRTAPTRCGLRFVT